MEPGFLMEEMPTRFADSKFDARVTDPPLRIE
jgi:hypothetical protein